VLRLDRLLAETAREGGSVLQSLLGLSVNFSKRMFLNFPRNHGP
jgi:hypothetical protein